MILSLLAMTVVDVWYVERKRKSDARWIEGWSDEAGRKGSAHHPLSANKALRSWLSSHSLDDQSLPEDGFTW